MNKFILNTIACGVGGLLIVAAAAASQASSLQPATIGQHETSLARQIKHPSRPTNDAHSIYIRCEGKVLPAGSVEAVACYSDPDIDEAFYRAIQMGSVGATVTPAIAEGEAVSILMLFTVIFSQQNNSQVVHVLPHHGTNIKTLGMDYIAPQKYGRSNQYHPRTELGLLWIDTVMDVNGEPGKVSYIKTEHTNAETRRYAKRYIQDNTFIPGHMNGKPTAMRFVKPIYGYRNGFTWDNQADKCGSSALSCDEFSHATGKPRFVFDD